MHLSSCTNFLTLIVNHREIPEHCVFKGKAILLLSFLLIPLANLLEKLHEDDEDSEELAAEVVRSLEAAMELVPSGFVYATLSVEVANEFTRAMESYPQIFATPENLSSLKKLLLFEVSWIDVWRTEIIYLFSEQHSTRHRTQSHPKPLRSTRNSTADCEFCVRRRRRELSKYFQRTDDPKKLENGSHGLA